jgi:hypothetical protein
MNDPAPITVEIPLDATVPAIQTGSIVTIEQMGGGVVTVVGEVIGGSSVTVNAYLGGLNTAGQYAGVKAIKVDADTWTLFGGV